MSALAGELRRAADCLCALGRGFALVGGLGVSARGAVRFTRDIDFAVTVGSDEEAESLVRDLRAAGYEIAAIVEDEDTGRLSTVRLRSRARILIDILTASSGVEREIVEREGARAAPPRVVIEGVGALPVAAVEDLLATKILAMSERRPQDAIDAGALIDTWPELDVSQVRERLTLIRERGFDRGEDLEQKLARVLAAAGR